MSSGVGDGVGDDADEELARACARVTVSEDA